jgi:glutaconate CoA-transferase subunit A
VGAFYVERVVLAPRGAWPLGLADHYPLDAAHLAQYAEMARTEAGFALYLDRFVYERRAA